jgi:putative transposase
MEGRLRELVEDEVESLGGRVLEMEVMPDHVHLLVEIPPQVAICEAMRRIKGQTSRVLRSEYPARKHLPSLWTRSYFVSSVGGAPLEVVRRYVEQQKAVC